MLVSFDILLRGVVLQYLLVIDFGEYAYRYIPYCSLDSIRYFIADNIDTVLQLCSCFAKHLIISNRFSRAALQQVSTGSEFNALAKHAARVSSSSIQNALRVMRKIGSTTDPPQYNDFFYLII